MAGGVDADTVAVFDRADTDRLLEQRIKIALTQAAQGGVLADEMVCLVLHDAFGFGEKRLTMFLGNHKRLFFRQQKMVASGTQIQYINERMNQIFRKSGFPQEFFDQMLGEIEI